MADLELFQFLRSHYNEKARWALDFKGVPHVRHTLLPGPHKLTIRRLSGQVKVPVIRHEGEVVAGSAAIIDYLEKRFPDPPLYPSDPKERARALEIQAWFDEQLGPAIRRAKFSELMKNGAYFASTFTHERGFLTRVAYLAALPAVRRVMTKQLDLSPAAVRAGLETAREGFDRVAKEAGPTGHLVGETFSVADLSAAALLSGAVHPPGAPDFPRPYSKELEGWLARWRAHLGARWVEEIYRQHRGSSAEVASPS